AQEAGRSRIYGGIHYSFDSATGLAVGAEVGGYVVANYLLPHLVKVESAVVNDGSAQRSMVNSITVSFDRVVTFDPGAFSLERQGDGGGEVSVSVAAYVVDGRTVAVLTFSGPGIVGGSLADGTYALTIHADRVRDSQGRTLDGDGDGSA